MYKFCMKNIIIFAIVVETLAFVFSCSDVNFSYQFELSNLSDYKLFVHIEYNDDGAYRILDATVDAKTKNAVLELFRMALDWPEQDELSKPSDILRVFKIYNYENNVKGSLLYEQNPINDELWYFRSQYDTYKYLLTLSNEDFQP